MTPAEGIVFLFDVDNTLLDNDGIIADLQRHLAGCLGAGRADQYWRIFEALREELGYADYLGALQEYRAENPRDADFGEISRYLLEYPFAERLYAGALEVLARCRGWGRTVILSDGDVVFQPRKVERSGLYAAVEGRVLIYIHKELEVEDVERRFPARHYVLVDDKPRILTAVKKIWGARVTTVWPRQGHYANDARIVASYPPADVTVAGIGDLRGYELAGLEGTR